MKGVDDLTACVVIPAYNEALTIVQTVQAAAKLPVHQIIVVDDGSRDATAELARRAGAQVLQLDRNRGKGAAIQAALPWVKSRVVLLADADLGASADQTRELLLAVQSGRCDMAVAVFARQQRPGGGLGLTVGLARWGILHLTGRELEAPLSGQRALCRAALERLLPLPADFGFEVGLTVKALQAGLRVEEVPLALEHRVTGRAVRDVWHRGRQFYHVGRVLMTLRAFTPAVR
ncbi:MAG: hypothetical protein PWP43_216 [Bacillota bacterium]|jgi:glycosyltransferase involved in cell wall biosynthesis|nr:hypothetical protein [Bacillota bacterium]